MTTKAEPPWSCDGSHISPRQGSQPSSRPRGCGLRTHQRFERGHRRGLNGQGEMPSPTLRRAHVMAALVEGPSPCSTERMTGVASLVEYTVNQVISKHMVKRQQMRWSPRGAHLLLQVRTRVLNEELRRTFGHWYGGFDAGT